MAKFTKETVLNSKLHVAFVDLRKRGIIARHNFWCCRTCGLAGIAQIVNTRNANGKVTRGYVFYHQQDTDEARINNKLYLYYGGNWNIDSVRVGKAVVRALKRAGYSGHDIDWNGDDRVRIRLHNVL
jgi:hypothetical protein